LSVPPGFVIEIGFSYSQTFGKWQKTDNYLAAGVKSGLLIPGAKSIAILMLLLKPTQCDGFNDSFLEGTTAAPQ